MGRIINFIHYKWLISMEMRTTLAEAHRSKITSMEALGLVRMTISTRMTSERLSSLIIRN